MLSSIPQISVIIPLYNKKPFIARALKSVLAQSFHSIEVIVIDDGSTDNGPEIVSAFSDPRIQLLKQANAGPGAARNRGLRTSVGKYVVFLDADDEFMPDFLHTSLTHLQLNPTCALSVVDHFVSPEKIPWLTLKPDLDMPQGPWRLPNDISPKITKSFVDFFQSGAVLCLRDLLLKYGGFYENGCTYGEDNYIWLQIILNHVVHIDRNPLIWHHTENSELGERRAGGYPPWPKLTDPETIRRNCPDEYRDFLERLLAFYAILACQRCLQSGDLDSVTLLMKQYPMMSEWKKEYQKFGWTMRWAKLRNIFKY